MLQTLARSLRRNKTGSIVAIGLSIMEAAFEILIPLCMAELIDKGIDLGEMRAVWKFGIVLLIFAVLQFAAGILSAHIAAKTSVCAVRDCCRARSMHGNSRHDQSGADRTGVLTLGAIASFLTLSRNFTNPVSQISNQFNSIVTALAGASRIFAFMDEPPETDDGYVTLVNAEKVNGQIREADHRTGLWAWKHPHGDGTLTYTKLEGRVVFDHVDFGYLPGKPILHDISLYAEPGQKIAFVGATGAGKTTLTNLINRFYDIADGKIRSESMSIRSKRLIFAAAWALFCRTLICSREQSWKTFATEIPMHPMRIA